METKQLIILNNHILKLQKTVANQELQLKDIREVIKITQDRDDKLLKLIHLNIG